MINLDIYNFRLKSLANEIESTESEIHLLNKEILDTKNRLSVLTKKLAFFTKVMESKLSSKKQIEDILSSMMSEIFSSNYLFKIDLTYDANESISGIKFLVSNDGGLCYEELLDAYGEGEISVVSFVLHILLLLCRKDRPRYIIFDEPHANLNSNLQEILHSLILNLCESTDLQMTLITHMDKPVGNIIHVEKINGSSQVTIGNRK